MKKKLALAAVVVGILAAPSVFPCGAPFGSGISVNPQQDIIVAYKSGVETYVFQPTFCGTASSFGLILPIASTLTASPALSDELAFATVDSLSQPKYVTVTACAGRNGGGSGTAGSAPSLVDAGTTVVSSGRVGFLDWAQLKADSVASFTDWLTTNGYPYSDAASSVFSYYVQKGWYFVAFRISRSVVDAGNTTLCSALGPVKLSFATPAPVVPSRMASAAVAPATFYPIGFSWRIFGITTGDQQLAFADGANADRVLGYSGALGALDVTSLAGLAQAGDRLTKLTLTFAYGSTDPDVGLSLAHASDYREIRYTTQYVLCADAGADAAVDAGPIGPMDAVASGPDAEPVADTAVYTLVDAGTRADTAPQIFPDAATRPDAGTSAARDAAGTPASDSSARGWGCSVAGRPTVDGCAVLALLALTLAGQKRRRRGGCRR